MLYLNLCKSLLSDVTEGRSHKRYVERNELRKSQESINIVSADVVDKLYDTVDDNRHNKYCRKQYKKKRKEESRWRLEQEEKRQDVQEKDQEAERKQEEEERKQEEKKRRRWEEEQEFVANSQVISERGKQYFLMRLSEVTW